MESYVMFLIWINNKRLFELKLNEMFFLKKIILKMLFLTILNVEKQKEILFKIEKIT